MQAMSFTQDRKANRNILGLGDQVFLLTLLFIALKLTGYIAWSWWAVLAPVWTTASIALTLGLIAGFLGAYRKVVHNKRDAEMH